MIFKIIFLIAALKLHDIKLEPLKPSLLYTIPLVFFTLIFGAGFLATLIGGVIVFGLSYVYFMLLTKFDFGLSHFLIMGIGGVVLVGAI